MTDLSLAADLDEPHFAPVTAGGVSLSHRPHTAIWSVAPFAKTEAAVVKSLKLPPIGQATKSAFWAGHRQWLLRDVAMPKSKRAAITDQTGGWIIFTLSGPRAADVLARLCPLDLRDAQFPVGASARTEFAHMMALITRANDGFEIWVMRSFAKTAHHHAVDALRSVAAQNGR